MPVMTAGGIRSLQSFLTRRLLKARSHLLKSSRTRKFGFSFSFFFFLSCVTYLFRKKAVLIIDKLSYKRIPKDYRIQFLAIEGSGEDLGQAFRIRDLSKGYFRHSILLSVFLQDLRIFLNLWVSILHQLDFWNFKNFLNIFKFFIRVLVAPLSNPLNLAGSYFSFRGKVSVSGNSRKRSFRYGYGRTGAASANLQTLHSSERVGTFTGVLNLKLALFFNVS